MKIKGNILKSRMAFVKERFGDAGWEEVRSALSAHDQKTLGGIITNSGWYPFEVGKRLDEAIVATVGRGSFSVFGELGRASARENLGGVHHGLLTPGDPEAFLRKAQMIYQFYYDVGRRTWESTGPGSGVLTTNDAETYSEADCATVIGWYKEALSMCGARMVRIEEEACRGRGDDVCRYRVSWS